MNRISILFFSLFVQTKINAEPMGNRAEKNKEMPDEMCAFFLHRKGGDAYGIQQATGQNPDKERYVVGEHFRQEYQAAPAEDDIEGDMNLCGS